jgi:hypothetical protein
MDNFISYVWYVTEDKNESNCTLNISKYKLKEIYENLTDTSKKSLEKTFPDMFTFYSIGQKFTTNNNDEYILAALGDFYKNLSKENNDIFSVVDEF